MESIIATFHIDWKLIIAQMFNFALAFGVLYFFAIKPVTKIMRDRSSTIAKSLEEAKAATQRLDQANNESASIIKGARQEGQAIVTQAQAAAAAAKDQAVAQAKAQVAKIVAESKVQLAAEYKNMVAQAQAHLAELVTAASRQVLGSVVDKKIDQALQEHTLAALKKSNK